MASAGGAGGAAGEQGSRHRNGVAALLAVHGLVGIPVDGRPGAIPVRLHLEGSSPVDDIACEMQDAANWYVQCKRRAGRDQALRDAILQWTAQPLAPADRVALASREFRGLLRELQPAIDQYASGRGAPRSDRDESRLDDLVNMLEEAGAANGRDLLRQVLLIRAEVEQPSDAQQANAVAMLAGTIVNASDAPAAFEALRAHMQLMAARREWSGVADWVGAIDAAGIPVFRDGNGAPGAQAAAVARAITQYREMLAARRNMLDLSALRPGLGLIAASGLLGGWDVEWGPEGDDARLHRRANLANMTRRNARFVLTGHPGTGKSESLRQIAATLASDPTAPLPIFVDLRDTIASTERAEDITLDLILQAPSRLVAEADPAVLLAGLRSAVADGEAVLLVDGLDETRGHRGTVALGLARLLGQLPESTGFVLSTRPSALDAVEVLRLEPVRLQPPSRLEGTLTEILSAVSQRVDADVRGDWLADRQALLEGRSAQSKDIWEIPLLASLATLRIADDLDPDRSPAELLNDVIADSVKTWEELKSAHRDGLDPEMRSEMLLDGFVTIGRLINDLGSVPRPTAEQQLSEDIAGWGHSARIRDLLASQIVHFWDERVGVFIDQGGHLTARSRQFAELADVRWITGQPSEAREGWLRQALSDPDRIHCAQLAASQDAVIRDALVNAASRSDNPGGRDRAVDWLIDFWPKWRDLNDPAIERILNTLADAAEDALPPSDRGGGIIQSIDRVRQRNDGGGWHCVIALATAELSQAMGDVRDARLAGLPIPSERRELVQLLGALVEGRHENRPLFDNEREAIERLLQGVRPRPGTRSDDGTAISFDRPEQFISGVGEVVRLAVDHVDELSDEAPDAFFAIAHDLPMSVYRHVEKVLTQKGHVDPRPFGALSTTLEEFQKQFQDHHGLGWALRALSDLYPDDVAGPRVEMWRDSQLADFLSSMGWAESSMPAVRAAADEDPDLIATWFRAVLDSHELNGPLVATQARQILASEEDDRDFLGLITTRALEQRTMSRQVDCETAIALARGFMSDSSLVSEQVFELVLNAKCPGVAEIVATQSGPMMWRSRYLATIAGIANTDRRNDWLRECSQAGSAQRSALATILPQLEGDHEALAATLATDRDATVRHRADAPVAGATEWTCTRCYEIRGMDQIPCPSCQQYPSWSSRGVAPS